MSSSGSGESDSQRSSSSSASDEDVQVIELGETKAKSESTKTIKKDENKEEVEMKEYKAELVVDAGTGESKTKVEIDEEVDPHYQEHGKKIKVPIWKKFKKKQHETQWEIYPRVHLNDAARNEEKDFSSNQISTTKYSLLTFIPANLLQQFTHAINIYFLVITIITTIPQISPLNPITSIVPLLFVLVVNAIKEAVEDYNRYRADKATNSRKFTVIDASGEHEIASENLKVGHILKLKKEESCPADAVLLSTSLPGGLCYVETAQLDGETNLKIYNAPLDVAKMSHEQLFSLKAWFESKVPDVNLYKFIGKMVVALDNDKKKTISLEAKNLLLRGCKLKNTEWVFAVITFAGKDTKLSLNQKNPPFKSSTVEKMMNKLVAALFGWMVVCTIIMCVLGAVFQIGQPARVYLLDDSSPAFILLKGFFAYLILFSFLIPQSMMVTLEIVKVIQTKLMDWDENMRTDINDITTGMNAKTSNLNDELGLVKYIFSDKTGTLTQNKMEFARSSVRGKEYSTPIEGELSGFLEKSDWKPKKPDGNPMYTCVGSEKAGDVDYMLEYLFCLAICHTAVANFDEASGDYKYEAQSPDEVALCNCAKKNQFQFVKSESAVTHVKVFGMDFEFKVLNCAEFTSERARMSIIVQFPDGKIKMYMKGADSVMLKRINMTKDINKQMVQQTAKHLDKFSVEGLRTLVLGVKELSQKEFDIWHEEFHAANTSLKDREGLTKIAYEKIEKDMDLIGCTAIEDKLQDGVPDAIDYLLKAGTKVWVITGDKQETAINIGKSTKLLKNDQPLVVINVRDKDDAGNSVKEEVVSKECEDLLKQGIKTYKDTNQNPGLVINGVSLTFALNDWPELFLELSGLCSSVVCCRVTPFQKASIVRLVKTSKKEICLAIGDGANDVSMIQEAHIGIGIFGREGTQAARASDYAIQQFSHVKRLLVVHGRYSYVRNTTLVETSLYKNLSYFFVQFWFGIFCGFSGVTVVDDYLVTFYNILFTSGSPFFIGLQEKDIAEKAIEKYPRLYEPIRKTYTYWGVFISQLSAIWHSLVFFGVSILIFNSDRLVPEGYASGVESFGTYIATYAIATTLLRISLVTKHWTGITIFFNVLSMVLFWLVVIVISNLLGFWPVGFGMMYMVFAQPAYWLGILIALFFALIPDLLFFVIQRMFFPTARQIIQEEYFENKKKRSDSVDLIEPKEQKA